MDWYEQARARQQEMLQEADASRLLRSARRSRGSGSARLQSHFMVWLGGRLEASGKRIQAQYK